MWWVPLAVAGPQTAQLDAACAGACRDRLFAWAEAQGGRRLLPEGAGRRDPASFVELGLDRLLWLPDEPGVLPSEIAWIAPDRQGRALGVPDDADFGLQWGLANDGTMVGATAGADVGAVAAWDVVTGDALIAVLDSGVSPTQPDLALWTNPGEVPDNGLDDDGNGYADDVRGWDFAARDADPSDVNGHGTNVASIAAAVGNNGSGLAGVCWGCTILSARNLDDDGLGWYSWWTESLVYAVDNGAQVVNMSEGGYGGDPALEAAVIYAVGAGVPVVVANGNDASDQWPNFPAFLPAVIAVGATRPDDARATTFDWGGGSSYGPHLDLVAPGTFVYGLPLTELGWVNYWSGSSQATPYVAGAAALLLSLEPTLTPDEVRAYLEGSAADAVGLPAEDVVGWDPYHGHGRLDVAAAVSWLAADLSDGDGDGANVREGDCDDGDAAVGPGATESCNGVDDDCDGDLPADEGDTDGDGLRDCDELPVEDEPPADEEAPEETAAAPERAAPDGGCSSASTAASFGWLVPLFAVRRRRVVR